MAATDVTKNDEQGDAGTEWTDEMVEGLCSTDLGSMRQCLLEKIVNQKKMELMRSPEVMAFIASRQNRPDVAPQSGVDSSDQVRNNPSEKQSSEEKTITETEEKLAVKATNLRTAPDDPGKSDKTMSDTSMIQKGSGDKSRKRTLERPSGERRSLRSRRDDTKEEILTSQSVDSSKSVNAADSRTREDRTLPSARK